jgi:cellulose synthase/poly-beta-1,6-N-acetylglucosamine synthase-like glycosyltransferase
MSARPAISVAVPLYNKAGFIENTLRSALSQSFADFEIVVVDDGSTDDGAARSLSLSDPRLVLIKQENAGVAAARNRAIAEARGTLIAFLDADDIWAPDHLRHLMELTRRYPEAALYGNRFTTGATDPDTLNRGQTVRYERLDNYFALCAAGRQPFFTSSCMVRRDGAQAVGGFPDGHSRAEDITLWIKLAARAPVAVSSYWGCEYRTVPQSLTSKPLLQPDIAMQTLEIMIANEVNSSPRRARDLREYCCRLAIAHALDCARAGQAESARSFLRLAAGTATQRRRWWGARIIAFAPPALTRFGFAVRDRLQSRSAANTGAAS